MPRGTRESSSRAACDFGWLDESRNNGRAFPGVCSRFSHRRPWTRRPVPALYRCRIPGWDRHPFQYRVRRSPAGRRWTLDVRQSIAKIARRAFSQGKSTGRSTEVSQSCHWPLGAVEGVDQLHAALAAPPSESATRSASRGEFIDRRKSTRAMTVPLSRVADRDWASTWTLARARAGSSEPANAAVRSRNQQFVRFVVVKDLFQHMDLPLILILQHRRSRRIYAAGQ